MTPWDARAFARGATMALLCLGLVAAVTAASDEGGLAWGVRAGRTLPLAPVCAAVGAWLALAPARARGDDLALETLGRSPWQRHAAAVLGGAVVAAAAALVVALSSRVDIEGFYPRAEATLRWHFDGASFLTEDRHWRIALDGTPTLLPGAAEAAPSSLPRAARAAAALSTALAGLGLPVLAAQARSRADVLRGLGKLATTALLTILAFQAAAAARIPALVAPLPSLLLLAWAASGYRSRASAATRAAGSVREGR